MMKILLCSASILIFSLLVRNVCCQEDESSGGSDGCCWNRIKIIFKSIMREVQAVWNEFADEIRARIHDMRAWTGEAVDSLKRGLREWVNNRNDISDEEKSDMLKYIERLEVKPEDKKS